eukprot:15483869-Alexandrium_andersonii.AAC.1
MQPWRPSALEAERAPRVARTGPCPAARAWPHPRRLRVRVLAASLRRALRLGRSGLRPSCRLPLVWQGRLMADGPAAPGLHGASRPMTASPCT